jgi:hypothetical protein
MRHIDGIYTQKFNRVHHRDGALFRGRYKAILIDAEQYFLSVLRCGTVENVTGEFGLFSDERVNGQREGVVRRVRKIEESLIKSKQRT